MELHLNISGDGMQVDKEITLTQAGKIIAFIGNEAELTEPTTAMMPLVSGAAVVPQEQPLSATSRPSVRELIDETGPKTHPQRMLVFGHHLAQIEDDGLFSGKQIKEQYQLAREKLPTHYSREFDKAISAGWLEQARGQKDKFFVTRIGEEALANGFATSNPSPVRQKSKAKSSTAKTTSIDESLLSADVLNLVPVEPTIEGMPNFHTLKSKGLKIMWILTMANSKGVERLSTREISYLASKLRDRIDINDMNAHTQTGAKNGWIVKDSDLNYSILHDGEERLKSLTDATDK